MITDDAVTLVQDAYGDFSRGDIASLLARLTDDVTWETPGQGTAIPFAGPRRGKAEVAAFFQALGASLDFSRFDIEQYVGSGDNVVALIATEARVRATGVPIAMRMAHAFGIRDGKIASFYEYSDTRPAIAAFSAPRG